MVRRWYADGGDARFRFAYPLSRDSLVLDVGGYEGQWASDLYARYRCRIVVFEPVRAFAAAIQSRFARNDDIRVLDHGLGASTRTETIYLRGAGSSIYRKRADAETVRIVDAARWLDDNAVASVQLMKINAEGAEFELLERLIETGAITRFDNIQVQFHDVEPDSGRRMEAIQQRMLETHRPTFQYRFVWENWARRDA